ncbi:MAG: 3-oxoadipate enol-lactonase [Candidatus Acidiferrum sp.]
MPFAQLPDARIHYELSGPPDAPLLLLSHALGVNLSMWEPQVAEFSEHFQVLRYDTRGHGASSISPGDYSIALLAQDVLQLLDALGVQRAHFCGLSMGGMVGMWLAANAPQRFHKIVLGNTAVKIGTPHSWATRIETVRKSGMVAIVPAVIERWFTFEFRVNSPEVVAGIQHVLETTAPQGYVACCAAVRDMDYREHISAIRSPALIISGTHDPGTTPADGHFLSDHIPGARYVELPAAHVSTVEDSVKFSAEVVRFLNS